jgi:transposase
VRRDLEVVGAAAKKREKQPVLLQMHIEKRQAFARDRHLPDAEKILFSDEAYVYERDSGRFEWCFEGESATPIGTERFVRKISLFGIIGIGVRKVRVVEEDSIDRFVYVDLLRKMLLPLVCSSPDLIFMQDNAPAHTAKYTKDWLNENNVRVLSWPPKSPDMNPIENFWAQLKHKVSPYVHRKGVDLAQAIRMSVKEIPQENVDVLVRSFPLRLESCVYLTGVTRSTRQAIVFRERLSVGSSRYHPHVRTFSRDTSLFRKY